MSCWEVLGIEATDDERTVRRAYSKKIKEHRPDEDPEGFQLIRKAYEDCLWYIQYDDEDDSWDDYEYDVDDESPNDNETEKKGITLPLKEEPETFTIQQQNTNDIDNTVTKNTETETFTVETKQEESSDVVKEIEDPLTIANRFMDQFREVVYSEDLTEEQLDPLLLNPEFLSIPVKSALFKQVMYELSKDQERLSKIKKEVILRLDDHFAWSDDELSFLNSWSVGEADRVLALIQFFRNGESNTNDYDNTEQPNEETGFRTGYIIIDWIFVLLDWFSDLLFSFIAVVALTALSPIFLAISTFGFILSLILAENQLIRTKEWQGYKKEVRETLVEFYGALKDFAVNIYPLLLILVGILFIALIFASPIIAGLAGGYFWYKDMKANEKAEAENA